MTASNTDDWSLMLLPDPAAQRNRARDPMRPASTPTTPAPQSAVRSPAAVLDDLRDRFDAVVRQRVPVAPVRRFYRDGRLDGYMQIVRQRVR
ncbi:hypothetical protein WKW77_12175 [Variovorax ureilyticus]|uniref:Uncharacterized protein n=1 Tax=Variovorax ureilyticus TaxID=1836198 RepID=A0ABU8VE32_9BURK